VRRLGHGAVGFPQCDTQSFDGFVGCYERQGYVQYYMCDREERVRDKG